MMQHFNRRHAIRTIPLAVSHSQSTDFSLGLRICEFDYKIEHPDTEYSLSMPDIVGRWQLYKL